MDWDLFSEIDLLDVEWNFDLKKKARLSFKHIKKQVTILANITEISSWSVKPKRQTNQRNHDNKAR